MVTSFSNLSTCQKLPHTTVDIPTKFHEVWWKESKIILNPPFFVSMATAAKFVQPIPIFFCLSRSTRCGCCSYQVSSISVRRVTCYDQFCVFQFFSILAVSMATAAILKKSTLNSTTSHGIWSYSSFNPCRVSDMIRYHVTNLAWIETTVWLYLLYICHTVIHRKLLAEQKLMELDRNSIQR